MDYVCRNCGSVDKPEQKLKGHFLITLILMLFYIVPGIIYMIWRRSGLKNTCSTCGSDQIVSVESAAGQAAIYEKPSPLTHVKCPDCRELVRKDATKCKHCQAVLIPTPIEGEIDSPSGAENIGRKVGQLFAKKR